MRQIFTREFMKKLYARIKEKEVAHIPQTLAFNFIMAIIPLMIVFFQLLAYFSIETNLIYDLISFYIPRELHDFLYDVLTNTRTNTNLGDRPLLMITTLITSLWIISKGFYGIFQTFNEDDIEKAYHKRLLSFAAIFITLIIGVASSLVIAFSHWLFYGLSPTLLKAIDALIFVTSCTAFFTTLFWLVPNKKEKIKRILPGVLTTTIGFMTISVGFAIYTNKLANYHQIYGSLAVIIILLIWLYLLGFMINLGMQINYLIKNATAD